MNSLCVLLIAITLSSLVDASAIKGFTAVRQPEEARSIKLASISNNIDKSAKVVAGQSQVAAQAPSVPILESSKKIYNDESIRRLAQQPIVAVPEQPAVAYKQPDPIVAPQVVQQAPVVVKQQEPVVPVLPAVPVAPVAPVVPVVAEPVAAPVAAVVSQKEAVIEPKSAPVVEAQPAAAAAALPVAPVAPSAVKPAEELPQPSDRSAPIKNESPIVAPVVPVVEPAIAKVVPEPAVPVVAPVVVPIAAPVEQQQPPVEPVVAKSQPEPVKEASLQAKKDEPEPLHIEVPAPDPGLVLSEPIDSTTKLLIDLDEHVQKFLPAEDQQQPQAPKDPQGGLVAGIDYSPAGEPSGKSSAPLAPYFPSGADEAIVPPLPALEGVEKASSGAQAQVSQAAAAPQSPIVGSQPASPSSARQGNHPHQNQQQVISQLLDQLETLQKRITDTIDQLVARRRYVMSALLRPMGTYVRRVRTNLERLQNRVNQLQAAAVSVGGGQNRPGGFVDAAAIETIRRRIDDISKRISDIVNRIRFSLTPTSAPLNSTGR